MNNVNEVKADLVNYPKGAPDAAIVFIFSVFTWLFFGMSIGVFDPSAQVALGLVMIATYLPYLHGSICSIQRGDTVSGVTYLIFTGMFAGAGAMQNFVGYYNYAAGASVDMTIFGWIWLLCAIIILPVVATMAKGPWIPFVTFLVAAVELGCMGIAGMGGPAIFNTIAICCFVVVGTGGMWMAIAGILQAGGINAPLGKQLFK